MDYWDALIYGLIQGATEFLPVSSSGHLALLPGLLDLQDPGVAFDLLMHLGTALAVVVYFRSEVRGLLGAGLALLGRRKHPKLAWLKNFILSTFFSVILILCLENLAAHYGRGPTLVALNLIFFGIVMWLADRFGGVKGRDLCQREGALGAIAIGLAQALAIFPGVSRSGVTLIMGRLLGMGRRQATRYSFLLSLPIIFAGVLRELPALLRGEAEGVGLGVALLGILFSFALGMLAIHYFLKWIERFGLAPFAFYRVVLGGVILSIVFA